MGEYNLVYCIVICRAGHALNTVYIAPMRQKVPLESLQFMGTVQEKNPPALGLLSQPRLPLCFLGK